MVRLVKGAYWDHEVVEARQHGWTPPVWEEKAESDRSFEALTRMLVDAREHVRPAIASHNLRSVAHAIAYNRATGGADGDLELQVLRGLGDELAAALAAHDLRVRIYCPVGDMVGGHGLSGAAAAREHLERVVPGRSAARRADRRAAGRAVSFANEPVLELRRAPVRESLLEALRALDQRPPLSVPLLVGGDRGSSEGLDSTDPGTPVAPGGPRRRGRPGRRRGGRGGRHPRVPRLGRAPGRRARRRAPRRRASACASAGRS